MYYLDLFAGIGGFALGAYNAGWRFDRHYFSEIDPWCCKLYARRFPDAVPLGDIREIKELPPGEWIITGGFPCQPFSTASRGRKTATDLWPEMLRVIRLAKPRWIIAENVERAPIAKAISDCRYEYECEVYKIPAAAVGAAHYRDRYWMVAHANSEGKSHVSVHEKVEGLQVLPRLGEEIDPSSVGKNDGLSGRMDRLRGLGNAIVPQIAEMLFRGMM